MNGENKGIQVEKGVEYYPKTDELLLIRCPKCNLENWAPQVATGSCAWCGYDAWELVKKYKDENKQV